VPGAIPIAIPIAVGMGASYRDRASATNRSERGTGSLRERSPGVWEVRVVVGFDPARARSIQRSFTVHGDAALPGKARRELVAEYGSIRSDVRRTASVVTVGELLEGYLGSAQLWKPATVASHHHVVSTLAGDPLCRCRLQWLTPAVMRAAICRWRDEGVSVPKVSARWLLLRGAVSWAVAEGLLRLNPLAGMRGPPRPRPRRHHSLDEVRRLLAAAGQEPRRRKKRSGPGGLRGSRPPFVRRRAVAVAGPPRGGLRGAAGRAGGAAAVGPGRPGAHYRAEPFWWRARLDQVRPDPAGNPRVGYRGHDPRPLPRLGGPGET